MKTSLETVDDLERAELLIAGVYDILSAATNGITREACSVLQYAMSDALGCLETPMRAAHDALKAENEAKASVGGGCSPPADGSAIVGERGKAPGSESGALLFPCANRVPTERCAG